MAQSVLITGGAGFIGCALAARLVDLDVTVTALDVLHPQLHVAQRRPPELPTEVRLIVGDVTDPDAVSAALATSRPDTIVHLAAETGTAQSLRAASRHGLVNVVGTTRVLDAVSMLPDPPAHIVLASSRAVYGEGQWIDEDGLVFAPGVRRHEDLAAGRWDPVGTGGRRARPLPHRAGRTATEPASVYAATKLAQEHVLTAWCASTSTALSVLRLQNVYGAGQSPINDEAGILARFARLALSGRTIEVFEDGAIQRDFVHVDDATAALAAAVLRPPPQRRLVDIGLGRSTSMLAVARQIAHAADAPEPIVTGRFRDGDVRAASCDLGAATDDLGYQPIWTVERGVAALVAGARRARLVASSARAG